MEVKLFIRSLQSLYGDYPEEWRPFVVQYLEQYNEKELDELFKMILATHSTQYKAFPDIAIMEKARDAYYKKYDVRLGTDWVRKNDNKMIEYVERVPPDIEAKIVSWFSELRGKIK